MGSIPTVSTSSHQPTEEARTAFRILAIDGGGIRGLIPALVLQDLEARVPGQLADYFHLIVGTSTGGLIALGLTAPGEQPGVARLDATKLVALYRERGPEIFRRSLWQRLRTVGGWLGPKYSSTALARVVHEELGEAPLSAALRDVIAVAYGMTSRDTRFFKRWRAVEDPTRDVKVVDAALATASAPTYFPSHEVGGDALVDGGVFAANPTVAGIVEALKRHDAPVPVSPKDLFVVSLGTGTREASYPQRKVAHWGRLGWIWPSGGGPPLIGAMLDGQSDAAHHWAHMLMNHDPGDELPAELGRGPRYFRLDPPLPQPIALDDAGPAELEAMSTAAAGMIAERRADLDEVASVLTRAGPLSQATPPAGSAEGAAD